MLTLVGLQGSKTKDFKETGLVFRTTDKMCPYCSVIHKKDFNVSRIESCKEHQEIIVQVADIVIKSGK